MSDLLKCLPLVHQRGFRDLDISKLLCLWMGMDCRSNIWNNAWFNMHRDGMVTWWAATENSWFTTDHYPDINKDHSLYLACLGCSRAMMTVHPHMR